MLSDEFDEVGRRKKRAEEEKDDGGRVSSVVELVCDGFEDGLRCC
jgi:hypothetical protein